MDLSGTRVPATRLNTLVEFYAPELVDEKKALDQLTDSYGVVLGEVIRSASLDKESKGRLLLNVLQGHQEIQTKCKELSSKAAEIVQREIADKSSNNSFNSDRIFRRRS